MKSQSDFISFDVVQSWLGKSCIDIAELNSKHSELTADVYDSNRKRLRLFLLTFLETSTTYHERLAKSDKLHPCKTLLTHRDCLKWPLWLCRSVARNLTEFIPYPKHGENLQFRALLQMSRAIHWVGFISNLRMGSLINRLYKWTFSSTLQAGTLGNSMIRWALGLQKLGSQTEKNLTGHVRQLWCAEIREF